MNKRNGWPAGAASREVSGGMLFSGRALVLPDCTATFPGADIPPSRIKMEEVAFRGDVAREVSRFSAQIKDCMSGVMGDGDRFSSSRHYLLALSGGIVVLNVLPFKCYRYSL